MLFVNKFQTENFGSQAKTWVPKFLMLSVFIIGLACSKPIIRSFTPSTEKEKSSYGMVGFGLFLYSPKERNILNVLSSSSGTFYTNLTTPYIKLEEVVSVDSSKKKLTTRPLELDAELNKEDELSNEFIEKKFSETSNFFTLVGTEPGKKYVITEIAYTYRKSSSKGLLTTIVRRFPIDPYHSYLALPITPKPGEIQFLGTFMASVLKTDDKDIYGVEDPNPEFKNILDKGLVTLKIQPADSFIKLQRSDLLRDKYYGNLRPTPETMEIHFLNEILPLYENTFWEDPIREKLKDLQNI